MTETPAIAATAVGDQALPQPASATEALYRAALGEGRLAHYLPAFARFDELGVARPHWNHAAGWLGWHWLLYRRLWREALFHALAVALALAVWWWLPRVWPAVPGGVHTGLLACIGVIAVVVPGWWGDAWLHARVRRHMTAAVRRARTVQEACALLAAPSPSGRVWLGVLLLELGALATVWRLAADPAAVTAAPTPEPVLAERVIPVAATPADPPRAEPAPPRPAETPAVPAEAAAPAASAAPAAPAPDAMTAASTPAPSPPPVPVPVAAPTPAAAEPGPPPAAEPRARLGGHGVAVGIFADPANAERAATRLRGAGLPVVTDPVESARGSLTRVRVGPFSTREEAQAAAETVRNLGLEARLYGPR
jgi:cell division septation protein DedD